MEKAVKPYLSEIKTALQNSIKDILEPLEEEHQ